MRALLPLPSVEAPPTLWLAGDLDLTTTSALARQLDVWVRAVGTASAPLIDVSRVTFIDLAGLRQLVTARERLLARGGAPTLRGTPRCVRRLLELTGREQDFGLLALPSPVAASGSGARPRLVEDVE